MDTNMSNNYVLKAMDAYPYQLEETVENLNYALAYEANNAQALLLMGRLQAEQFRNYEKAKQCYEEALANKLDFIKVYGHYISTLILNEDYSEAQKLIDFAFKVKGLNKAEVNFYQGLLFESTQKFKKAMKAHKKAKLLACNQHIIQFLNNEIARIENKIKSLKKAKCGKNKKKKKK